MLYQQWFVNYPIGLGLQDLVPAVGDENEVNQALGLLENSGLIQRNSLNWGVITIYGIDVYEQNLPPSFISQKLEERRLILEALKEVYDRDVYEFVPSEVLLTKVQISDGHYLKAIIEYLGQKGLVDADMLVGTDFLVRLNAQGYLSLHSNIENDVVVMTSAYAILFNLENHLRQFIESKMRSKVGSEWWSIGVTGTVKNRVDEMKEKENKLGWKVSKSDNNTEYLLFEQLEKIITANWKEVFESVFHNQQKIIFRLRELEGIRNAIAHTRMLSPEGMTRLEQYSQDLFTLTTSE